MGDSVINVHDVAKYIIEQLGEITTMKLQKLVYYCQAWSLVWDEEPLFPEKIEAWMNGPVVRELYDQHKGRFRVKKWNKGDISKFKDYQKETVDSVLNFYGNKNSQWLSDLTHKEDPWRLAREGMTPNERGSKEITLDSMMEYYISL